MRRSVILGAVFVVMLSGLTVGDGVPARGQTQTTLIPCGQEVVEARQRAQILRNKVARCRQRLAEGHPSCVVIVPWKKVNKRRVRISMPQAEQLANSLGRFAADVDALDQELAELNSRYDVVRRGTFVNRHEIKCYLKHTSQSPNWGALDRRFRCVQQCMAYWVPKNMACWKGDIRTMGLCLINASGRMAACRLNCRRQ